MKNMLATIVLLLFLSSVQAAVIPCVGQSPAVSFDGITVTDPGPFAGQMRPMRIRDAQKLLGRKLTLKEKIVFKFVQWKIKKGRKAAGADEKSKKGTISLVLGILSLLFIFLPYVALLSIPAAILAIILGNAARKENPGEKHGRIGIILGWVTLALFLIALIIALAWLSGGYSWFG